MMGRGRSSSMIDGGLFTLLLIIQIAWWWRVPPLSPIMAMTTSGS